MSGFFELNVFLVLPLLGALEVALLGNRDEL